MNKAPRYIQYNGEKKIALLDNSAISFMEQIERHEFLSKTGRLKRPPVSLPQTRHHLSYGCL